MAYCNNVAATPTMPKRTTSPNFPRQSSPKYFASLTPKKFVIAFVRIVKHFPVATAVAVGRYIIMYARLGEQCLYASYFLRSIAVWREKTPSEPPVLNLYLRANNFGLLFALEKRGNPVVYACRHHHHSRPLIQPFFQRADAIGTQQSSAAVVGKPLAKEVEIIYVHILEAMDKQPLFYPSIVCQAQLHENEQR